MNIYDELKLPTDVSEDTIKEKYWKTLETYNLVLEASEDNQVRELARKKVEKLKCIGEKMNYPDTPAYHSKNEEEVVRLEEEGKINDFDEALFEAKMLCWSDAYSNLTKINDILDRAEESGEKYYLKAVIVLKQSNYNISGCNNAIPILEKALEYDSSNNLYLGLFNAIKNEIGIYNDKVAETRRAQEERERRIKAEVERKKRNEFIGKAVGAGAGIFGLICICSCCSECCSGGCC